MLSYTGSSFDNNTSVGYSNLVSLSTGAYNTSVGAEAMMSITTGNNNTGIGNHVLISTTGSGNSGLGASAGNSLSTGNNNTFLGYNTDATDGTITNSTALGSGASLSTSNTIQLGNTGVTDVLTSANYTGNSFIKSGGTSSQFLKADGSVDASTYLQASDVSGSYLPLTGGTLTGNLYGTGATFSNDINVNNISFGIGTGAVNTNLAIGKNVFSSNNSGNYNIAIGENALNLNSSGNNNVAVGAGAVYYNGSSSYITALGVHALHAEQGEGNTAVGYEAGARGAIASTLTHSTFLGQNASAGAGTIDNATAIGYGANVASDNTVQLGNTGVTSVNTSGSYTGNGFIKSGGTSSQFLKADGSVDANTYLTSSGTLPVANGGTGLTSITSGEITFGNGTSALGTSSDLFWDNTNSRLGILTTSPSTTFQIGTDCGGCAENFKYGVMSGYNAMKLGFRGTGWLLRAGNNSGVATDLLFSYDNNSTVTEFMAHSAWSDLE